MKTPEEISQDISDQLDIYILKWVEAGRPNPQGREGERFMRVLISSAIRAERSRKIQWPTDEDLKSATEDYAGSIVAQITFIQGANWMRSQIEKQGET